LEPERELPGAIRGVAARSREIFVFAAASTQIGPSRLTMDQSLGLDMWGSGVELQ